LYILYDNPPRKCHFWKTSVWMTFEVAVDIQYDTIEEFNMDSTAEHVQLNLAHIARKI